jgi:fumarylacetoacetase
MKSWIPVLPESHFPIQNIPLGIFSRISDGSRPRAGAAIGEFVLDLALLADQGLLDNLGFDSRVFCEPTLNSFMSYERPQWRAARSKIQELLSADDRADSRLRTNATLQQQALVPMIDVKMHMPALVGDYTDFYSSREHATNVGIMFRGKDNALQPNWLHLPVGYHGRASSVSKRLEEFLFS